jgi:hypothetical protein
MDTTTGELMILMEELQFKLAAVENDQAGHATAADAVSAVSIKPSPFWKHRPGLWFKNLEAYFESCNPKITVDGTKYGHLVSSLDDSVAAEVEAILDNPCGEGGRYEELKAELLQIYARSQASKDSELLTLSGMGNRKATSFMRYLKNLQGDKDSYLLALFMSHLPSDVAAIVTGTVKDGASNKDLAAAAEKIMEAKKAVPVLSAARYPQPARVRGRDNQAPPQQSSYGARPTPQQQQQQRRPDPFSLASNTELVGGLCAYHQRFNTRARQCNGNGCKMACLVASAIAAHDVYETAVPASARPRTCRETPKPYAFTSRSGWLNQEVYDAGE